MTFKTNFSFINAITLDSAVTGLMSESHIGSASKEKMENKGNNTIESLLGILDDVLDILNEEELLTEPGTFLTQ